MLNWRRDPAREMQIERSKQRTNQLESEIEQLKRDNALLSWMHSELDLIEADLPSNSTPPPTTAANLSDC
jgi:cell division protein FtsB